MASATAGRRVDLVKTLLEEAVASAGEALRQSDFGTTMQTFRANRRKAHGTGWSWITALELNQGPPIQRALTAAATLKAAGKGDLFTVEDSEYLGWASQARLAIQRITAKCWSPIPAQIRTLIVDEDDLPDPLGHGYIRNTRVSQLGDLLGPVGLKDPLSRAALRLVWSEAKATPAFLAARESAEAIASDPSLAARLRLRRSETLKQFQPHSTGEMLVAVENRCRELITSTYANEPLKVQEVALSIRAYNRLVQHVLWSILGLAERNEGLPPIVGDTGPIRVRYTDEGTQVAVSYWGDDRRWFPDLTEPFELVSPLTGIYLITGFAMSFAGREIIDLTGKRLGSLEGRSHDTAHMT